jgi:hypothetical protein
MFPEEELVEGEGLEVPVSFQEIQKNREKDHGDTPVYTRGQSLVNFATGMDVRGGRERNAFVFILLSKRD